MGVLCGGTAGVQRDTERPERTLSGGFGTAAAEGISAAGGELKLEILKS